MNADIMPSSNPWINFLHLQFHTINDPLIIQITFIYHSFPPLLLAISKETSLKLNNFVNRVI